MFSIVNEIKDNSPSSMVRVIVLSIGSAASIYLVVAITGYITFGNDIVGNIVLMCKCSSHGLDSLPSLIQFRPHWSCVDHWQGRNCYFSFIFHPPSGSPLPRLIRRCFEMATKPLAVR